MMDRKSKYLLWFICLLSIVSVCASYYRYMVLQDIEFYTEGFSLEEEE